MINKIEEELKNNKNLIGFIYCTTNLINGKKYIGQKNLIRYKNYLGSGNLLLSAIKKYGRENFKIEILEFVYDKKILNEAEIYWIDYFNACNSKLFYNIATGGHNENGISEIQKKQISETLKSKNIKPPSRKGLKTANVDIINLKKLHTEGHSMNEIARKLNVSNITIKNRLNDLGLKPNKIDKGKYNRGKKQSEERKNKVRGKNNSQYLQLPKYKLKKYLDEGLSYNKIAKIFNCYPETVSKRIKDYGLKKESNDHYNKNRELVKINIDQIREYLDDGLSIYKIAIMMGYDYKTIRKRIEKYELNKKSHF